MAKKKHEVVIVDKELTPTVLATIDNKKNNLLGLVVLIAIFGAVIYFLPDIQNYIDSYLNPELVEKTPVNNSNIEDNPSEEVTLTKYPYSPDLVIDMKSFSLTNFNIGDNKLNFKLNNKQQGILTMNNYNYYLELYTEDSTLLQRIKLEDISLGATASTDLDYDLTKDGVSYFILREINRDDYPAYKVPASNDGKGVLNCTKKNEKVNYLLQDNKVYAIENYFEVSNTDIEYNSLLSTYQTLSTTYNAMNGVTSSIDLENDKLVFLTTIDLSVNDSVAINKIVYPKDTDAKIMKFELSTRGYTCE